ncbi:MAG: BamA/TamA family outer membrane protein [Aureliella sp.]
MITCQHTYAEPAARTALASPGRSRSRLTTRSLARHRVAGLVAGLAVLLTPACGLFAQFGAPVNRYQQTPPANPYIPGGQVPAQTAATGQPPPYIPPAAANVPAPQPAYVQPTYTPPNAAPPAYAQPSYAQPTQPGYTQPAYGQPGYAQPSYGAVIGGASGGQAAPYVTSQSSGVQSNYPPGAVAAPGMGLPSGPAAPAMGYGAQGTYQPDSISAFQVAPGVTGSIDPQGGVPAALAPGVYPPSIDPSTGFTTPTPYQPRIREAPIDIYVQEARTGRIVLGGSVNSDLGLAGQVIIDERNFDYRRLPTSWSDLFGGRAFRGAGQSFRAELMPGTNVQRYTVNFTQPHLFGYSPISFSLGGFLFSRQFRDWTEQRLGGRVALGYDITRDLSATTELRMEDVKIYNPRLGGIPELDRVLGSNDLYTARFRLAHDTRDSPFMATEGHLIEMIYDQVFGEFDYPRGQLNYSRYFLVRERADGGGRHTLATTWKAGITGADTPLFENFFAGGYSTLRGFSFRGASPKTGDLQVGGRTMFLGSLEYLFPLTADDMLRGILFVDYGALSKDLNVSWDDYRIAPGLGVRVNVPALGPAPLAFDFAFPVKYNDADDRQVFSFFMGFTR